jgi:hypothetical protein
LHEFAHELPFPPHTPHKSSTSSDVDPYATDTALDLGFLRLSTLGSKKGSSISHMHLA